MDMPREDHFNELFHIFAHLRNYHNIEMVFDPSDPVIDDSTYHKRDWTSSEFGKIQGKEEIPRNIPHPRWLGDTVKENSNVDHNGDTGTRRSIIAFLVYNFFALAY